MQSIATRHAGFVSEIQLQYIGMQCVMCSSFEPEKVETDTWAVEA